MNEHLWRWSVVMSALFWPGVVQAQMHHHHPARADTTSHRTSRPSAPTHRTMTHEATHQGMDMSTMDMGEMPMSGMYGPYAMSREASSE